MNVLPIAYYLQSKGLGEVGKSIFVNTFPANAQSGILLRAGLPGARHDPGLPGYLSGHFQFIVRKPLFEDAQNLAVNVASVLSLNEKTIGALRIKQMFPETYPVAYPLQEAGFVEFSSRVRVSMVDESWVLKLTEQKS